LAFSVAFPHQVFHLYGKLDDGWASSAWDTMAKSRVIECGGKPTKTSIP
jgi:hypothetical protein